MAHTGNARGQRNFQQVVGTVEVNQGVVQKYFGETLTLTGIEGGTSNAIGDYSTPDIFYWTATENMRIERLVITVEDNSVLAAAKYGGLDLSAGVGIQVNHYNADFTIKETFNDKLILSLLDWGATCYDVAEHVFGAGNNFFLVRWTFGRSGVPIRLTKGEHFGVLLSDDYTGLVSHLFVVQGLLEDTYD